MAAVFRSCGICSLRIGCFLIAGYTLFLALLLLSFSTHDLYYARNYIIWSRVLYFVFAVLLFVAAVCLFTGTKRSSRQLLGVWVVVFANFILFEIISVCYNIYYYNDSYYPMPLGLRQSALSNILVFGLLIFLNIICLLAVHSHRSTIIGF
ncbi:hypothetical protein BV898_00518 [Hypsibius exemplaris]|uniref:MARVEL domain-containing protein n=1 Tax=Hypsibius exemplaris TaxID=2072580 RepID=A0A1W0XDZ5_HYPEX|nr:hypothetical protein BV898_00518 [Hypsibius exemplaris]